MDAIPKHILAWQMVRPESPGEEKEGGLPASIEKRTIPVPELKEGEVLVEIAGCGLCHTDMGYLYGGVPTVSPPPLTLGHEISGRVVAGQREWIGKEVIVPAVMPCRRCFLCRSGRANRCLDQKMPGNSMGPYGGFASHIPVPCVDLCEVRNRGKIPLSHLAVVADAVTTPFQAAQRAGIGPGDNTVVIGVGGVGQYMAQHLSALGAGTVIVVDIHEGRLEQMRGIGVDLALNARGMSKKETVAAVKAFRKKNGLPSYGWKIFEASGTKPGQELGLALLGFTGKLVVIGFGLHKVEYSISRLMAFDAEIIGTWGCPPEHYPAVLNMVVKGMINIGEFVELRPMGTIREALEEARSGELLRRIVFTPDF